MDAFNIIQVSFLSKFMNNYGSNDTANNKFFDYALLIVTLCCYIYRILPYSIVDYFEKFINDIVLHDNTSFILIPYHNRTFSSYGGKHIVRSFYSSRFHALNHHIKKNHVDKLHSLTEIVKFQDMSYLHEAGEYVLLPKEKQKILIDKKNEIYFEILLDCINEDKDEKKDKISSGLSESRKYVYKIWKKGKDNIHVLNEFLEYIEKEYEKETNLYTQTIFEYKKSIKDEDDKQTCLFSETPFNTNKSFHNVFFDNKPDFIEFIDKFNEKTMDIKYEKYGIPFKGVIMLHGPPGCGKTSLIKSTIKYTNRHCVIVSWVKIKTCSDFVNFFRPLKINNKTYHQKDLIIVFEDFDANNSDILKIRENLKTNALKKKELISSDTREKDSDNDFKKKFEDFVNVTVNNEDELTLEYILNILDGIVELHNSIIFFTTNDIQSIDPALTRIGRVDKIIEMNYASANVIIEMLKHYYNASDGDIGNYKKQMNKLANKKSCAYILQKIIESSDINTFFKASK